MTIAMAAAYPLSFVDEALLVEEVDERQALRQDRVLAAEDRELQVEELEARDDRDDQTKKMLGVSSGTVTERNCRHGVAPSSSAASYSSGGMFLSPAPRMIIEKPSDDQRPTMATAKIAAPGVEIQYGPSMPTRPSSVVEHPEVTVEDDAPDHGDRGRHRDVGQEEQHAVERREPQARGVQQAREPDGDRDAEQHDRRVEQRVAERRVELGVGEQPDVVLHPREGRAAEDAPRR